MTVLQRLFCNVASRTFNGLNTIHWSWILPIVPLCVTACISKCILLIMQRIPYFIVCQGVEKVKIKREKSEAKFLDLLPSYLLSPLLKWVIEISFLLLLGRPYTQELLSQEKSIKHKSVILSIFPGAFSLQRRPAPYLGVSNATWKSPKRPTWLSKACQCVYPHYNIRSHPVSNQVCMAKHKNRHSL